MNYDLKKVIIRLILAEVAGQLIGNKHKDGLDAILRLLAEEAVSTEDMMKSILSSAVRINPEQMTLLDFIAGCLDNGELLEAWEELTK